MKKQFGLNNEKLQLSNRSLVLGIIVKRGVVSRKELVELTGLGKAAITNIIKELLEGGIVEECDKPKKAGQRKTKGLTVKEVGVHILSVRWMRDGYKASVFSFSGHILAKAEDRIQAEEDIEETTCRILETMDGLIRQFGEDTFLGICVGIPGPYIRNNGFSRAIVNGYEKLQQIDVQRLFESHFSCIVLTEHDAHLSAFCEWADLSRRKHLDCKCLLALQSIGVGIGAGIVFNGDILEGAFGIAGEIGQIGIYFNGPQNTYGGRGTLEYYASSASVKNYVCDRLCEFPDTILNEESNYREILAAYEAGDKLAEWAFDMVAWRLAYGLLGIIFVINPELIVIEPDYPVSDHFIGKLRTSLSEMLNPEISQRIMIQYSDIPEDTTLKGGYEFIIQYLADNRSLYEELKRIIKQ